MSSMPYRGVFSLSRSSWSSLGHLGHLVVLLTWSPCHIGQLVVSVALPSWLYPISTLYQAHFAASCPPPSHTHLNLVLRVRALLGNLSIGIATWPRTISAAVAKKELRGLFLSLLPSIQWLYSPRYSAADTYGPFEPRSFDTHLPLRDSSTPRQTLGYWYDEHRHDHMTFNEALHAKNV